MSNNALIANLIKMTLKAQKEVIFSPKNMTRLITLVKRMQQSFRLMVGVLIMRPTSAICRSSILT